MGVTFGDERLVAAHQEAVAVAFAELERYAGRRDNWNAQDGSGKRTATTGNVITAAFTHDASREHDAQLHTHLVTVNATFDEKTGRWYALENGQMFAAVALAGRIYQSELAQRVQTLGYQITEDRENGVVKGFEIAGVTVEDRELQSTRRAQIEAEIENFRAAKGRPPTTREIHIIATETRQKKLSEITTPEVRAKQLAKYSAADRARLHQLAKSARSRSLPELPLFSARQVIDYAAEHLLERKAVVTRKDVLTFALQENLGTVRFAELREALAQAPTIVSLTQPTEAPADTARLTSTAQLEREQDSVRIISAMARQAAPLDCKAALSPELGRDQKRAVTEFLHSRDCVQALLGRAGAGKTHTLREIDRLTRLAGVVPLYAAPTHAAKEILQDDGFEHAETVAQVLLQLRNGETSLTGRLLVVDEAGMLSTKQGSELLRSAEKASARVLLVGDEKQLTSVEAGDWLGMLLRHSPLRASVLQEIRRQTSVRYREAMMEMSQGNVRRGLAKLDKQGWVHEGRATYLEAAARAWLRRDAAKEPAILVAPTWREIDQLNEIVRVGLADRGTLTGTETTREVMDLADYTAAQRKVAKNYAPGLQVAAATRVPGLRSGEWVGVQTVDHPAGVVKLLNGERVNVRRYGASLQVARAVSIRVRTGDTLMLQGNDRKLGIVNGERVTVLQPEPGGGLRVRQMRGRKAGKEVVLPSTYKTYVHGYAVTAHKSQGATVPHAIVAAERMNGRETYVATSRGQKTIEVHVPDKDAIFRAAKSSIDPVEAALDHPKGRSPLAHLRAHPPQAHGRERLRAFVERQRALFVRAARAARGHLGRMLHRTRDVARLSHSDTLER
jgi:ATP-dependent exoDNAse (exonuclease V) alpha subunit